MNSEFDNLHNTNIFEEWAKGVSFRVSMAAHAHLLLPDDSIKMSPSYPHQPLMYVIFGPLWIILLQKKEAELEISMAYKINVFILHVEKFTENKVWLLLY